MNYIEKCVGDLDSIQVKLFVGRVIGIPMKSPKITGILSGIFNCYCFIVFIYIMIFYTLLEIIDAIIYIGSLESTTENLCLTVTHIAGIVKLINLIYQRSNFTGIIELIGRMTETYSINDEQKKTTKLMNILSLLVFIAFFSLVSLTAIIGVVSMYMDSSVVGNKFPFHVYIPNIMPRYIEMMTFGLSVGWNALIICVHDCLLISLMNHICCQLIVLQIALKRLKIDKYLKAPIDEIRANIEHHQLIIDLRNRVENIFSLTLMLQFLTSLMIFGMTGFQATVNNSSSGTRIVIYAYCCCIFFELFVYCWFANQVIQQSNTIILSAYSSSWYLYGREYNQRIILLMMKAQVTIELTAGGFFSVSLETLKTILTKTYSSVALLRQVYYK